MQGIFYFEILYTKTFEARQRSRKDPSVSFCPPHVSPHSSERLDLEKGRSGTIEEQSVGILPSLIPIDRIVFNIKSTQQ